MIPEISPFCHLRVKQTGNATAYSRRNDDEIIDKSEGHITGIKFRSGIWEIQAVYRKKTCCAAAPDASKIDVEYFQQFLRSKCKMQLLRPISLFMSKILNILL